MSSATQRLQARVRLKFTRPLDYQEQFHLLHLLSVFRQRDPQIVPSQVSNRFRRWNENFAETEIAFQTSDSSRVELLLVLTDASALWREALWYLVRQMEAELRTTVQGRLLRPDAAAAAPA